MTTKTGYRALIETIAARYALDADLLEAQIVVESSGNTFALHYDPSFFERYIKANSKAKGWSYGPLAGCSYGLLQIELETALEAGFAGRPEDLFTPQIGLDIGAKVMRGLIDWASGDVERALVAYNSGKGNAMVLPYRDIAYAQKVFQERDRS